MWCSLVVVFFLAMLFAGTQSKIHPRSVHREIMNKLHVKRQSSDEEDRCVEDKLESTLENSECMDLIEKLDCLLGDIKAESKDDQKVFDDIFWIYCLPECGKLILEAQDECGVFDDLPDLRGFVVGACGTNSDGKRCYEYFYSALNFYNETEAQCYVHSKLKDSCDCRYELMRTAEEQDCCINVYHDFFQALAEAGSGDFSYKPHELYTELCNIRLLGNCSDSPLSDLQAMAEDGNRGYGIHLLLFFTLFG